MHMSSEWEASCDYSKFLPFLEKEDGIKVVLFNLMHTSVCCTHKVRFTALPPKTKHQS